MGFDDIYNYVIFGNPLSRTVKNVLIGKNMGPPPKITVINEKIPLWKLAAEGGRFIPIAGIMGASAVALGAYGAHKTYPKDAQQELKPIFETANRFHFLHSLALLGVPMCRSPKVTCSLMLLGTTLFSGACYYHAFTGENKFGKLAPIGGTILIVAWLTMII